METTRRLAPTSAQIDAKTAELVRFAEASAHAAIASTEASDEQRYRERREQLVRVRGQCEGVAAMIEGVLAHPLMADIRGSTTHEQGRALVASSLSESSHDGWCWR